MFLFPHGGTVDRDGNLWMTDARGQNGKGNQVFKFSPDGKVLLTLGKPGVSGSGPDLFDQPTDVVVAPNGDIFVTDSHRNGLNNRIVKFTKDGKYMKEWGRKGAGPRRAERTAHDRDGLTRPPVRRRSREQPHPDLRPGGERSSTSGGSSAGRAGSTSPATTRSTSPTPSRAPTPAPASSRASRRASASAAPAMDPSRPSSRTWSRPCPTIQAPKASASTAPATSTARSCEGRCWRGMSENKACSSRFSVLASRFVFRFGSAFRVRVPGSRFRFTLIWAALDRSTLGDYTRPSVASFVLPIRRHRNARRFAQ